VVDLQHTPFAKEKIMSSTTVTRGNSHETFYIAPSLTPTQVAPNTTSNQTFSLPGLQLTDIIMAQGFTSNQTAGIVISECDCLTANVLTIQFANVATASATPQTGIYEFQIVRAEGPLPTTAV
jgi:hypothetical protein